MRLTCVAVMCVHNEEAHLRRSIGDLVDQGIDVALIDHGSTDGTREICAEFLGKGLLMVEHMPWTGVYDQTAQLKAKHALIARLSHDWVIHADADEWMHTRVQGETLLEGISRVASLGFNAINFEEFVFLPKPEALSETDDCKRQLLDYYFFAPSENRLMRAWNRQCDFTNLASGGHMLTGPGLRLAPEPFVLRHYVVLSQAHAVRKYVGRVFSTGDLDKGWHGNRLDLSSERLRLPSPKVLKTLDDWERADLDRSDAKSLHFWDWPLVDRDARSTPGALIDPSQKPGGAG